MNARRFILTPSSGASGRIRPTLRCSCLTVAMNGTKSKAGWTRKAQPNLSEWRNTTRRKKLSSSMKNGLSMRASRDWMAVFQIGSASPAVPVDDGDERITWEYAQVPVGKRVYQV